MGTKQKGNNRSKKSNGQHRPSSTTTTSAPAPAPTSRTTNHKGTKQSGVRFASASSKPRNTFTTHSYISLLVLLVACIWKWNNSSDFEIFSSKFASWFQFQNNPLKNFHHDPKNSHNHVHSHTDEESKDATNIQNFLTWLKEHGAIISPSVTIAPFPEFGGFGLQAKPRNITNTKQNDNNLDPYAIQQLDEIFTIPESIIISSKSVFHQFKTMYNIPQFDTKMTKLLSNYVPSSYLVQQDVIIALYLMVQCELDDHSLFKPYMDILPNYIIPRLDTFNNQQLELLQDDELTLLAKESYTQLQSLWKSHDLQLLLSSMVQQAIKITHGGKDIRDHLKRTTSHKYQEEQQQCLSFQSFHKYISIVSSRAMVLQGTKYLTPLAEFANYEPRQDERKKFKGGSGNSFTLYHERSDDTGSITVRADRNVEFGAQIFEDYGEIDNSLYLEAHGFVPNENPFHCAVIPAILIPSPKDVSSTARNAMIALKLLPRENSNLYPPPTICILDDGSILDGRSKDYLTIVAMDLYQNQDLVTPCHKALDSNDEELIQLQCLHYIGHKELLDHFLQTLSLKSICQAKSSLEDDLSLLESFVYKEQQGKDMTKEILALKFRIADKHILYNITGSISDLDIDCSQVDETLSKKIILKDYSVAKSDQVYLNNNDQTKILLQKFNTFLDSLDMPIRKVEATLTEGMRIGVVAKEDIDEGDIYLSINSTSSVINSDTARSIIDSPKMNAVLDHHKSFSKDGGFNFLLLFLMHEKFISKGKSKWNAYIDLLPTIDEMKQSSPLFIDDELYDYAAGSDLRVFLIRHKQKAEDLFIKMSLNKDILRVLGPTVMQKDHFFWAYSIVDSRSIWWNGKRHLVPLLDLVNCMEERNEAGLVTSVHKTFVDESNNAITRAARAFKKGEQIFENYGQPNHIYFLYHGFTLGEHNTHDCAHWGGLGIGPNDKAAQNMPETKARLSKSGFTSFNPTFCLSDRLSLHQVVQFVRIKHGLDSKDDEKGLSSDVIPLVTQYLNVRLRKYSETKRIIDHNDPSLSRQIKDMVNIVDKEMNFFRDALNIVKSVDS